jgi:hypothetical protein
LIDIVICSRQVYRFSDARKVYARAEGFLARHVGVAPDYLGTFKSIILSEGGSS